jgi:hypothetical protein
MKISAALLLACVLALAACQGKGLTVIPQDAHSLDHYALGLRCQREGRYLLAREHFELARATARDMDMTRRCDAEIAAMDRAVRELR